MILVSQTDMLDSESQATAKRPRRGLETRAEQCDAAKMRTNGQDRESVQLRRLSHRRRFGYDAAQSPVRNVPRRLADSSHPCPCRSPHLSYRKSEDFRKTGGPLREIDTLRDGQRVRVGTLPSSATGNHAIAPEKMWGISRPLPLATLFRRGAAESATLGGCRVGTICL